MPVLLAKMTATDGANRLDTTEKIDSPAMKQHQTEASGEATGGFKVPD